MNKTTLIDSLLWAGIGALFLVPLLGGVHLFDWDEINFAEISREMILRKNYLQVTIDFQPFYQKPPLFFWLQALSMHLFGVNEFAARFPNAVCGMLTLVILYHIGSKLRDRQFGHLWALTYFGSILPFLYFKSGIIDPVFNLFIFLGIYGVILFYWKKEGFEFPLKRSKWWYLFLGAISIGLGILTKGPVALLIAGLTMFVYWVYQRFRFYITIPQILFFVAVSSGVMFIWFGVETMVNGPEFVTAFIAYNYELFSTASAGHRGFPGYHFIVLLIGCFPASIFALRAFRRLPASRKDYRNDFRIWMKYLFWVVLILFTIVRSKIVHYSSMCYFPLTFLAATVIYQLMQEKISRRKWMGWTLGALAGLFVLLLIALPILGQRPEVLIPLFNDPFAQGNLAAEVNWTGWEVTPAVFLVGILFWSLRLWKQWKIWDSIRVLFGGTAVFCTLVLVFFINRVEHYSQRAAIEFFEEKIEENAYVYTFGYKSYAHLFYTRKKEMTNPSGYSQQWLLTGNIDKPVYLITKVHKADQLRALPEWKETGAKNGFVFFKRVPNQD